MRLFLPVLVIVFLLVSSVASAAGMAALNEKCDKEQLKEKSEVDGEKDKTTQGIKELKENVDADLEGDLYANVDTCGYNQGCEKVAEKFPKEWKDCMTECCKKDKAQAQQVSQNPPQYIAKLQGCAGSYQGQGSSEDEAKDKASKDCKKSQQEHKKCNEKASEKANKDGNQEIKDKQSPGKVPNGSELTQPQGAHCADVVSGRKVGKIEDILNGKADVKGLTNEQLSDLANNDPAKFKELNSKYGDVLSQSQKQAVLDANPKAYQNYLEGGKVVNNDGLKGVERATNGMDKMKSERPWTDSNPPKDFDEGCGAMAVFGSEMPLLMPSRLSVRNRMTGLAAAQPCPKCGRSCVHEAPNQDTQPGNSKADTPRDPRDSQVESAKIAAEAQKEAANTQAEATKSAAMMGAMAQVAAAVIPALLQQKNGNQQGTTQTASSSTASLKAEEMPGNARTDLTGSCAGVTAPTQAQIVACQGLGFNVNNGVITPKPTITQNNLNVAGGPNILTGIGTSTGTLNQVIATQPGASVETIVNPASPGSAVTASAIATPTLIRDIATEGTFIGDYKTNTMVRYPSKSTADKPVLTNWFNGVSLWAQPDWPAYQFQGLPKVTVNYQLGGADAPSSDQTVNIASINPLFVKVVPKVNDMRIDFKGDHSFVTTLIQDGVFRGSTLMSSLQNVGVRSRKNFILQGVDSPSYLVSGSRVVISSPGPTNGKLIQSSNGVPRTSLSPQQQSLVYGGR